MSDIQALQKENDQWKTVLDCNEQIRIALQRENAELKQSAKYAEHIDATPANQRETMLYDTLKERDELKAESEAQAKRIAELEAAVKANHEWHQEHDDYDGYQESELCTTNTAALAASKNGE